jgi:hypothetical protein
VTNNEEHPIEGFKIAAFPKPGADNVLDASRSYFKAGGTIQKGEMFTVKPDEMKNEKGERLSDARMKVGVVHLSGTVNGEPRETFREL